MTRGPSIELSGDLGEPAARRGHSQDGQAAGEVDGPLDGDGDGARGDSVGGICMAVGVDAGHSDEQVAAFDVPRVVGDSRDLDAAIAFEHGSGHAPRQVLEPHVRCGGYGVG